MDTKMTINEIITGVDKLTDEKQLMALQPSLIMTLYDIHTDLRNKGLTKRDLVTLCMDRLRRKSLRRNQIEKAIEVLMDLEKKILKIHGIQK